MGFLSRLLGKGSASPARRSAEETTVELASPASGGKVVAVAVTPDGRCAVSASWDNTLRVWDLASGKTLHILKGHTEQVIKVISRPMKSLDEVVGEIVTLDKQLNRLATEGKGNSDPEWSRCDHRLTAIGRELHEEGGEARMRAALQLAYQKGMRGRYVDRHWTGIGTWMG